MSGEITPAIASEATSGAVVVLRWRATGWSERTDGPRPGRSMLRPLPHQLVAPHLPRPCVLRHGCEEHDDGLVVDSVPSYHVRGVNPAAHPSRFAIAMQSARWILRNDLIWLKPNFLPRPGKDRLRLSHEHFFPFVKRRKEVGRPTGSVWIRSRTVLAT